LSWHKGYTDAHRKLEKRRRMRILFWTFRFFKRRCAMPVKTLNGNCQLMSLLTGRAGGRR